MIENQQMYQILSMLLDRTERKEIEWKESEENEFQISFPQSTVLIRRVRAGGLDWVDLMALNASGQLVGSISTTDNFSVRDELYKLYDLAKRRTFRVDETLNDIMSGLKKANS